MVCGGLTKSTWVCGVLFMLASQSGALRVLFLHHSQGIQQELWKAGNGAWKCGSSLSRWQINEILWNKYRGVSRPCLRVCFPVRWRG